MFTHAGHGRIAWLVSSYAAGVRRCLGCSPVYLMFHGFVGCVSRSSVRVGCLFRPVDCHFRRAGLDRFAAAPCPELAHQGDECICTPDRSLCVAVAWWCPSIAVNRQRILLTCVACLSASPCAAESTRPLSAYCVAYAAGQSRKVLLTVRLASPDACIAAYRANEE